MNIAFIPVRGGSKSIPLKNIKKINGKPLIYWTAKAANEAKCIDKVIIATDSLEIKKVVESFTEFLKIEVYDRDKKNAQDNSTTESVMLEYIENKKLASDDMFFLIQATSPLLQSVDIEQQYNKMLFDKADSSLTCVRIKRFFWTDDGVPINYNYLERPRRQDFSGVLVENGACYINKVKNILHNKNRLFGKVSIFEMTEDTFYEIDEPIDFIVIEKIMEAKFNDHPSL